jgi:hypothetical protein
MCSRTERHAAGLMAVYGLCSQTMKNLHCFLQTMSTAFKIASKGYETQRKRDTKRYLQSVPQSLSQSVTTDEEINEETNSLEQNLVIHHDQK